MKSQYSSSSARFTLDDIAVRLRADISRLEYQRGCVCDEATSALRTSTIQRYDDMLDQRRLLLAQVEADQIRLSQQADRRAS